MGASTHTVGRFQLERELAVGPFGQVFLAVDPSQGWRVAIKIFAIEPGAAPADTELWAARVVHEAKTAALVLHPNIASVHEVGLTPDGAPFLVRDYVHGHALADYARDPSPTLIPYKLRWIRDFAHVLAVIHQAGLLDRDPKPRNALVRQDGVLKVLDFGVARRSVDRAAGIVMPQSDRLVRAPPIPRVVGTPAYMAPEQFGHRPLGPATDQFAWGVSAFEVLTGALPWEGAGGAGGRDGLMKPVRIVEAILTANPVPLRALAPDAPPALEALLLRCLARPPEARFPSMDAVLAALAPMVP